MLTTSVGERHEDDPRWTHADTEAQSGSPESINNKLIGTMKPRRPGPRRAAGSPCGARMRGALPPCSAEPVKTSLWSGNTLDLRSPAVKAGTPECSRTRVPAEGNGSAPSPGGCLARPQGRVCVSSLHRCQHGAAARLSSAANSHSVGSFQAS